MKQQPKTISCKAERVLHSLDLAKFIGALFVVFIHTSPIAQYSPIANFYITDVLARIAVPMFFAISGFLFSARNNLLKTCIRLSRLYLVWSVVYLLIQIPQWYEIGWWGPHVILDYCVALVTKGTYFHLWYLLAAMIATPVLYLLLHWGNKWTMVLVLVVFWTFECLVHSYTWIGIEHLDLLNILLNRFSGWFAGLFRGLPLMLLGVFSRENCDSYSAAYWRKGSLLSFLALTAEASLLYFCTPNKTNFSYLFTTPLFTYYFLCFLLRCEFRFHHENWAVLLRNCSVIVYCIHPFIAHYVQKLGCLQDFLWAVVMVLSVALSVAYTVITLHQKSRCFP